ncbi:MAG: twin-arginine translocation signal domain-containing protein [Rhodocyclaceae bacterium]
MQRRSFIQMLAVTAASLAFSPPPPRRQTCLQMYKAGVLKGCRLQVPPFGTVGTDLKPAATISTWPA